MKTRVFKYIEISPPKTENFQIKNSDILNISAQNRLWVLIRTALMCKSPQYFLSSFKSFGLFVQEKKRKIDFQVGSDGDYLEFRI